MMEKKGKTLLIFTSSYPYFSAAEDTFIEPELPFLQGLFEKIIIIPKYNHGSRASLLTYIKIDTSLAEYLNLKKGIVWAFKILISALLLPDFYKELRKKPKMACHFSSFIFLIYYSGVAFLTKKWLNKFLIQNNIILSQTIFYTYWLNEITLGICQAKQENPEITIISRVHGGDLYETNYNPPYIPYRPEIFYHINKIFADSEKGAEYLSRNYPGFSRIFSVSRLGVPDPEFITKPSGDDTFRIVSCSFLNPVKRIELLIMGLKEVAHMRENKKIDWVHIGDGPSRKKIEQLAKNELPPTINYHFLGYVPKGGVIDYYHTNNVDLFINVSSSEGTPVSVMEAQSCGIPVMATSVGGNPEIVSFVNGFPLNADPNPKEIALSICTILDNLTILVDKRWQSRLNWERNYNPEKNFKIFVKELFNMN